RRRARDRLVAARGCRQVRGDRIVVTLGRRAGERAQPLLPAREVVLARELPRRLDRLRAAGDEERAIQVAGGERRDLGRELDRARLGVCPVRVERQLAHLLERRLPDLLAEAVADVHREETGERVEVALAVGVLEVAAVAAYDHRDLAVAVAAHAREVHPQVVLGELLQVCGDGLGHAASGRGSASGSGTAAGIDSRARRARRPHSTFPTITSTATMKMALATTFTCGGTATRAAPQTKSGNVWVGPETK